MIAFTCSHCGLKLKVKPEFAGRSSRCPTCKQPLVVPPPSQTLAEVGAGMIEGTSSSLVQAGVDGGVSLEQAGTAARPGSKSIREFLAAQPKKGGRYIIQNEIARGGMGAVLRAIDCDIRREVAVKYLLDQSDSKKKARFVEEAQITGQLEHPNIVPIHELGVDSQKRLFFAMKMVKGQSLAQVLDLLRANPRSAESAFSLGRLLNIFVSVCNALAYSHSCGVVHRDLKPANIMIGDFGEVYVMDWGLAKVCSGKGPEAGLPASVAVPSGQRNAARAADPASSVPSVNTSRSSKVETSRQPDADLTQEGAVLGTPVYMPPEQAVGRVQTIDQRSDVYSLGAILYEMLTLQPPIDKEGGYMAILMRVAEGDVVSPEQRNPQRAKAGKIPRELSAIAMKALAKNPQDRYPNVESLRRDIERFQEGRSVSAKDDTLREAVWKLAKRNKGFSVGAATALLVLLFSTVFLFEAWRETAAAQAAVQTRTDEAVPALVRAARLAINERQFDDALKQVELALAYAPENTNALMLKGQLLIGRQDFARAQPELENYLRHRPNDKDATDLLALCLGGKPDDLPTLLAIARVFQRQQVYGLVDGLLGKYGKNSLEARNQILRMYREALEKEWKGQGNQLQIDPMGLHLKIGSGQDVGDLSPLKGMPLTTVSLSGCKQLTDLAPLRGMKLTSVDLYFCPQVSDLTPLRDMRLTALNLADCGQVRDLTPLQGMPLASLSLYRCQVQDLSPLKDMPLATLDLFGCGNVQDLAALKGMPLRWLRLDSCGVRDLSPLQGMTLESVYFTPKRISKGVEVLRTMNSLKTISIDANTRFPADEFWRRYDAGEFNK